MDDMEHAEGWRKLFCNTYFSTIITLAFGFLLTQVGYANIWPLFGSANQLLSALVLVTLCVFLKVTGRNNKMLFPPLIIMRFYICMYLIKSKMGKDRVFNWRRIYSCQPLAISTQPEKFSAACSSSGTARRTAEAAVPAAGYTISNRRRLSSR